MSSPTAVRCTKKVVEQQRITGLELGGARSLRPARRLLDQGGRLRPVEEGAVGAGGQDVVESPGDDVGAGASAPQGEAPATG